MARLFTLEQTQAWVDTLKQIENEEAGKFDMSHWLGWEEPTGDCGTFACLAGNAVICNAKRERQMTARAVIDGLSPTDIQLDPLGTRVLNFTTAFGHQPNVQAARLLGMSQEVADKIFYPSMWTNHVSMDYNNAKTARDRLDVIMNHVHWTLKSEDLDLCASIKHHEKDLVP